MIVETAQTLLCASGLPAAWAGQLLWRVLDTNFGDGRHFLDLWAAWQQDPDRPALLHHVALTAQPPVAESLLDAIAQVPSLAPLMPHAQALREAWQGLLPGFHRLNFAEGRVQLTLCVAAPRAKDPAPHAQDALRESLRELVFEADTVWLQHCPDQTPAGVEGAIKSLAFLCRRDTQLVTSPVDAGARGTLRAAFRASGFEVAPLVGDADAVESLHATFNPRWTPRKAGNVFRQVTTPGRCLVIGGGLAGASAAFSLARRGWRVTVLDRGTEPAAGASGLPAGLFAPHVSADDRALSCLTRSGVRATLERAQALLREGKDWQLSGVLEHRVKDSRDLPGHWLVPGSPGQAWSRPATTGQLVQAGLAENQSAHWHARAGWIRPAALVCAMFAQPGITWCGGLDVARLERMHAGWRALDVHGTTLAEADVAVVAAGFDTRALLEGLGAPALPINPLRGQIAWAPVAGDAVRLPPFPVNGSGSLIGGLELDGQPAWIFGSTFERGCAQAILRTSDTQENFAKLTSLLPAVAAALRSRFEEGQVMAWAGVRCTAPDRLPVVGPVDPGGMPGLWVCTAMGARGITLGVLCGEFLAGLMHGEPLAVPIKQAQALSPQRWVRQSGVKLLAPDRPRGYK